MTEYHEDSKCGSCQGPLEVQRDAICETCAPDPEWGTALLAERKRVRRVIDAAFTADCKCGGAGPGEGCDVCNLYHKLIDALEGTNLLTEEK